MLIIKNTFTNPYFNLAAEEYLLKHFDEDIFTLWRNENAIIVGKHQNTLAEINLEHVQQNKINVVRRLSGGGAVFHDMGNINFTFINNAKEGADIKIDFKYFTMPIIEVLQEMGINAEFSGRNDLLIEGQKFSGNAEHIYQQKKRTLHHGTLLFASEIADLSAALKVNPLKFQDKAVKSFRSRVTNISSHLKEELTVMQFYDRVIDYIQRKYSDTRFYTYTHEDIDAIMHLVTSKYNTWEWNYGYSPKYAFQKMIKTEGGMTEIHMDVNKGIIEAVKFHGDFFNVKDVEELEKLLIGCRHSTDDIFERLAGIQVGDYMNKTTAEELVAGMF